MRFTYFERIKSDKQNASIQIAGLVLGILTCIFVGFHAFFEYSYDKFNADSQLIYRTHGTERMLLGPLANDQLNYVESYARLHPCYRGVTINTTEKGFYETNAYYADGELFNIFSFPIKEGNVKEALNQINNMVISERYAKKYFGDENPIGKTLIINGAYESDIVYTVTGVFKDIPKNSHLQFDMLFSIENVLINKMYTQGESWRWSNFLTYFKTNKPVDAQQFSNDLTALATTNGMNETQNDKNNCEVVELKALHLNGQSNYMDNNPNARDINIRILIALVIISIAWLNYINIGIGNALKNNLALGVKKVLGASSFNIWLELLQKSIILNAIAFVISVLLYFLLSYFFQLTGILEPITLPPIQQIIFWLIIFCLQMLGAFVVSVAIHTLHNRQHTNNALTKHSLPKKANQSPWMAVFVIQFTASIVLISFALFSARQVNELINTETGMQTSHVLAIHSASYASDGDIEYSRSVFEQEVLKIAGVTVATSSSYIPGTSISSFMPTRLSWKTENDNVDCRMNFVGYDYLRLFKHKLIAGRNFSKEFPSDNKGIIINETLAKSYGFANAHEALGKEIFWKFRNENRQIIGVIEDFHHQSADWTIEPTMFQLWDHARGYCLLKLNPVNTLSTLKEVEKLWGSLHKGNAFDYLWIDAHYQKQFEKWLDYVQIIRALSLIAILIACIGLYGLGSMLLNKQTKEIGIRKVNGAKISEVITLLSKNFVKWVVIAFVIATPIAYFVINKWLQNFACKTELSLWIFVLSGFIALSIALLTVSWQTFRAARKNPVEALRYE
jgi:putative ABC transport system permease protein